MEERPCKDCIWYSLDGCTSWDCEPLTRKEVRDQLKGDKKKIVDLQEKIDRLEKEKAELTELHYADMAQIVYQRRQIDFLMDAGREAKGDA